MYKKDKYFYLQAFLCVWSFCHTVFGSYSCFCFCFSFFLRVGGVFLFFLDPYAYLVICCGCLGGAGEGAGEGWECVSFFSFFFLSFFCKQSFLCLKGNLGTKKRIFVCFLFVFLYAQSTRTVISGRKQNERLNRRRRRKSAKKLKEKER